MSIYFVQLWLPLPGTLSAAGADLFTVKCYYPHIKVDVQHNKEMRHRLFPMKIEKSTLLFLTRMHYAFWSGMKCEKTASSLN